MKKLPWEEYKQRYARRIVDRTDGEWTMEEALNAAEAAKYNYDTEPDIGLDPEEDADQEMTYWDAD